MLNSFPRQFSDSLGQLGTSGRVAAADDWYLADGVDPADVVSAYKAIGAIDLLNSYTNLANPGTLDLSAGSAPTLGAKGWSFSVGNYLRTAASISISGPLTYFARITTPSAWTRSFPTLISRRGTGFADILPRHAILTNRVQNQIRSAGVTSQVQSAAPLPLSTDLTLAMVYSGGTIAVYINGVLDNSAVSTTTYADTAQIFIGGIATLDTDLFYNGIVSAISIYSAALNAPQNQAISAAAAALT